MIKAENVVKTYNGGKTEVLKGVSLEVKEGEKVAILGASGSGKSTLLSVLSGLERVDSGKIMYGERELSSMTEKQLTEFRRNTVGFIFQQYNLLPHLSVENNVKMGADLVGNKEFREIIKAVGLESKLKNKPSELSGGSNNAYVLRVRLQNFQRFCFLTSLRALSTKKRAEKFLIILLKCRRKTDLRRLWLRTTLT